MTVPTFQLPIAGQTDRHYDRSGPLEWVWCEDKFVLFKDGCAVAWLIPDDPPGQWLTWLIERHLPHAADYHGKRFPRLEDARAFVEAWTVREGLTPCQ